MENYYYSEINENELLDDDRCNSETFEVDNVGDDWVPSMTLNDFTIKMEDKKHLNSMSKLDELIKSKLPLTVEEIEKIMMNQDFFEDNNLNKNNDQVVQEEELIEFNSNRNQRINSSNNQRNHRNFHRQKGTHFQYNGRKHEEKSGSYKSYRNHNELNIDTELTKDLEPVPTIPYKKYIFPLTTDHVNDIIKKNLSAPLYWKHPKENFNVSLNNNLMVSKDFDIILRIQLQQMAERPEIQSYSSKWNRRLLARKHNLPIGTVEMNDDFQKNNNQEVMDKNDKTKNKLKEITNETDPNRIRKFGKSTYSTVRGARELIKVHNLTRDDQYENNEANDRDHSDAVRSATGVENSISVRSSHYLVLSRIVHDVLNDSIFNTESFADEHNYEEKVSIPGPLVYSIIEAGNDLLQDINYFDDEIENCPTGHLQARLRLDQELRETIDLIFQLLFGSSKTTNHNYENNEDEVISKSEESPKNNELLHTEKTIASLNARRWLINKILSIRKGRYFMLNLFHMPHISENYITILLESIIACNKRLTDIFKSSSIILPPLMALVPRVFRYRPGQDIMAPHEGFKYSGDIEKLIDDWRKNNGVHDQYDENYVTKEDLIVQAKLGVKIIETTALLSNRMMQSSVYRDFSLVPSTVALIKYYKPETVKKLLPYSSGVVFFALLYNSISVSTRQYELLKDLTKLLVIGFTDYLVEKDVTKISKSSVILSPNALKDSEPIVLCVLQRSTNDTNLRSILMNSIANVVGKENTDSFISELQDLIVKGTSRN